MSKSNVRVEIQICSNCKSHQWCTRHNEASYSSLAMEIQKALKSHDSSIDVEIFQVGGQKMGSFQITCNGTLLFSKLQLGYFPYVPSATSRILSFIEDYKNGGDLKKYTQGKGVSPNKGLQNNASGGFSPNSPSKAQGKRIKYNPDYKDPSRQENTSPFLIHDKHEESKPQKNENNKNQEQKPEPKHQPKQEPKHQQKKKEEHSQPQHHQQHKKQSKSKEQHHEKAKNQATHSHHEPQKKSQPKHQEHKADDHKKKDEEHKPQKEAHHKTQQHKKEEKHEQKKHEQKKAEEPKPHPQPQHKKQQQKQQADFVLAESQGDKATPHAEQKKEGEVIESHVVQRKTKQAEAHKAENKQQDKYDQDFENEEGKDKAEAKN